MTAAAAMHALAGLAGAGTAPAVAAATQAAQHAFAAVAHATSPAMAITLAVLSILAGGWVIAPAAAAVAILFFVSLNASFRTIDFYVQRRRAVAVAYRILRSHRPVSKGNPL